MVPWVVHINGYPGVGKLTVAKELVRLLGDARLVDNHVAYVDAASALFKPGSPEWSSLVAVLREKVYDAAEHVDGEASVVFTNVLYDGWGYADAEKLDRAAKVAEVRGAGFLAVTLTAAEDVHRRRLTRRRKPTKLSKWGLMKRNIRIFDLLRPEHGEYEHLEIDTSELTAQQTAGMIAARLRELEGDRK